MGVIKPHTQALAAALFGCLWPAAATAGAMAPPGEGDFTVALAKTAGALAVVLLLLLGLYWLSKKILPKATGMKSGGMKIVGRMPMGPRKQVVLLQVAGKVLVLGVGTESISRLATLESPEELALLGLDKQDFGKALSQAAREEEPG